MRGQNLDQGLRDRWKRPLRDLRVSVTDRCNFRCDYCMPGDRRYRFMSRKELLSFEEIAELAQLFARHGVTKLRITGGEPLLRRDLDRLILMLYQIEGIEDIALTTNGVFLARYAAALKAAGLKRVTVSLDSLEPETFARLTGKSVPPQTILEGIEEASRVGLGIKINMVVQRNLNEKQLPAMLAYGREHGHVVRFIEFMDVGTLNGWKMEKVVSAAEMVAVVERHFPCKPLTPNYPGEVARRYRFLDGKGEFGVIASVTAPFCGSCTRARLSADGRLFTCLFASRGMDLKSLLRQAGIDAVGEHLKNLWSNREDRYSELRGGAVSGVKTKVEMFAIGG